MRKKKICFCSTDWNDSPYRRNNNKYGGVSYYRLIKPMALIADEYDIKFYGSDILEEAKGKTDDEFYDWLTWEYDMIIVKQIDSATAAQALVHWTKQNKCILVQDYDDNMLLVREDQPAYKLGYNPGGTRWSYAASMMSLADALIVSTKPIKDYFFNFIKKNFNEEKDIYIYPNYNDVKDWKRKGARDWNVDKIVIGWAGSVTHDSDLKLVMPALAKILEKYPHVHLELLGGILQGSIAYLTKDFSQDAKKRIKIIFGTPSWDGYPKLMLEQRWDIGIAPLIDDPFNQAKSHIKWMEYSMMGIPTIASKVYPYTAPINGEKVIQDGITGLLATPSEWEKKLSYLIENKDERRNIGKTSYEYVQSTLQYKDHAEHYLKIVRDIFKKHDKK